MSMDRTIKAIAFDAYGTLFDVYSIRETAEALFPTHGERIAGLWRDKQIEYSRLRTMSGRYLDFWAITGDALAYACEFLGLELTEAAHSRLMLQYARLSPHPENLAALRRLKEAGAKLAILSNGTPWMLDSAVSASGMDGLFDHVISVDKVRRYKTAPEAYQLGPMVLGVPAREILFVSSNGWDACGAAWFGFTTFWINRADLPHERLRIRPTATGRTMDDLAAFYLGDPVGK